MQKFAVIGLGRFGSQLAKNLTSRGAEVLAIDKDRRIIEKISGEVAIAVRLDSTDEEALSHQGVDKVDAAIVGIGKDFEASVLTTVILKSMEIGHICCRAERSLHGRILKRIGANAVIYPEDESAQHWSFMLTAPQIGEKLDFAPGYSLIKYTAGKSFDKKSLLDLHLRKEYQVNLVGIRRGSDAGDIINVPMPDTVIRKGDLLWMVGAEENLAKLPK